MASEARNRGRRPGTQPVEVLKGLPRRHDYRRYFRQGDPIICSAVVGLQSAVPDLRPYDLRELVVGRVDLVLF
jgi:hypothetical protein